MTLAYYNEFDPFCADWLLELIADGLIAPGIVDRRSIVDVLPSDLKGFKQCHFFAGIGVWSLAARLAGWSDDRPLWTGSAPCQPFSAAGKAAGFDDERHLWPAWFHLIECAKPANVPLIGEQVASKDGRTWFDLVSGDMEGLGHACGALDTCAAGLGAPFIGQRLYWLAATPRRVATSDSREQGSREIRRSSDTEAHPNREANRPVVSGGVRRMGQTSSAASERNTGAVHPAENRFDGSRVAVDGIEPERYTDAGRDGGLAASDSGECNGRSVATGRGDSRGLDAGWSESDGRPASCGENDRLAASDGSGPLSSALSGIHSGENGTGSRHGEPERPGEFDGLAASDGRQPWHGELQSSGEHGEQPENPSDSADRRISLHPVDYWRDAEWLLCRDPNGPRFRPVESASLPMAYDRALGRIVAESSGARQAHFPLTEKNTYVNRLNEIRGAGNALNVAQASTFIECVMEYLA